MSRISTRVSIRWPPAPASEPTDTLVLSLDGYYVDLRIKKENGSIDWVLAGERIVMSDNAARVMFTSTINSQHSSQTGEPAPDIGDFKKLDNGDDLETGEMANPDAGGAIMPYEEIWRELEHVKPSTADPDWILESHSDDTSSLADKVFYAKIGSYYLALARRSDHGHTSFEALRQDFSQAEAQWKLRYRVPETTGLWKIDTSSPEDQTPMDQWEVGRTVSWAGMSCIVRAFAE